MASIEVTTAATAAPITVAEVKQQFKYTETAEDGLLTLYINAAVDYLENWLRRAFVTRTLMLRLDSFAIEDRAIPPVTRESEILLPFAPVSAIDSFVYDDVDGIETDFSSHIQSDLYAEPARIWPAAGESWPATEVDCVNTVRIGYDAGYASAAVVPEQYKQLLRWMVALWWRNREPAAGIELREVPHTVRDFVEQLKLSRIS